MWALLSVFDGSSCLIFGTDNVEVGLSEHTVRSERKLEEQMSQNVTPKHALAALRVIQTKAKITSTTLLPIETRLKKMK